MQEKAKTLLPLRMVVKDVLHPLVGGDVGVDFGGEDAFVAEHLLYNAEIGTVFHQVGGKGVAQGVRRDCFGNAGSGYLVPDDVEDHHAAQAASPSVEEKGIV